MIEFYLVPESLLEEDASIGNQDKVAKDSDDKSKDPEYRARCQHKKSFMTYTKKHGLKKELKDAECPICLIEFEPDHKVSGLACSNMHVYHQKCLE
jgi:hypothetical protein